MRFMLLNPPSRPSPSARAITSLLVATARSPSLSAAPGAPAALPHFSAIAPPEVTAKSIYVMDMTSGIEMYAKNPDEHLPIGSVVKIMTALVVIKHAGLDEQVVI